MKGVFKPGIKSFLLLILPLLIPAICIYAQQSPSMENQQKTGYAPVNGIKMYYEIYGKGDMPLVLIHGGGSTIESNFNHILPMFAAHYKVIAVELQAHGRTTDRDAPESFKQDAADVVALLKYLKVTKANILGFSNGATTTLQIAIDHPEVVNKIVVVSGAYRRDGLLTGLFDGLKGATLDNMPSPLKTAFLKVTPDKDRLLTMFNKDKQRMLDFKDIPDEQVAGIKAPALLMVAQNDVVTIDHTVKMSQIIKGAQLVVLPGVHGEFLGEVCTVKPGSNAVAITAKLVEDFLGH